MKQSVISLHSARVQDDLVRPYEAVKITSQQFNVVPESPVLKSKKEEVAELQKIHEKNQAELKDLEEEEKELHSEETHSLEQL
jgi:hypothetical protein